VTYPWRCSLPLRDSTSPGVPSFLERHCKHLRDRRIRGCCAGTRAAHRRICTPSWQRQSGGCDITRSRFVAGSSVDSGANTASNGELEVDQAKSSQAHSCMLVVAIKRGSLDVGDSRAVDAFRAEDRFEGAGPKISRSQTARFRWPKRHGCGPLKCQGLCQGPAAPGGDAGAIRVGEIMNRTSAAAALDPAIGGAALPLAR
jgi:hypothetical protein